MIKPSDVSIQTREAIHKRIKFCLLAIPVLLCLNLSYSVHFTDYAKAPRVLSSQGIVTNKMVRNGQYYVFLDDSASTENVTEDAYNDLKIGSETKLYVEGPYSVKQVISIIALILFYICICVGGFVWLCTLIGRYMDWVKGY